MSMPADSALQLMKKIQSLPAERIHEIEDFVDFLKARTPRRGPPLPEEKALDFPVDELGPWPEELDLRREALYGDDGR